MEAAANNVEVGNVTIYDILGEPMLADEIYSYLDLSETLNVTAVCKRFLDSTEQTTVFYQYGQSYPPQNSGLNQRQWVLFQLRSRHYYREQWLKSWDDSTFTRWGRANQFFYSDQISSRDRWRRVGYNLSGATIGGVAVGGTVYGVGVWSATKSGATAGAAAGTCAGPGPGTVVGTVIGGVIGASVGFIGADMLWSCHADTQGKYTGWKEAVSEVELHSLIREAVQNSAVGEISSCCVSGETIGCINDNGELNGEFVEDKTGKLFILKALSPIADNGQPVEPLVSIRHLETRSVIINGENMEELEEGLDIDIELAHRQTNLMNIQTRLRARTRKTSRRRASRRAGGRRDASTRTVSQRAQGSIRRAAASEFRSLTVLPAYRAVYATLCAQRRILDEGFPVGEEHENRIKDEDLCKVRNLVRERIVAKISVVSEQAKDQINEVVGCIGSLHGWSSDACSELRSILREELDQATPATEAVEFTPLLDLPTYFPEFFE
jgi:hypothetical protein